MVSIGKDLSLHYAGKNSGMFSEQKEFMYVNHNEKTIFTPEGFTKNATEAEVNYLKNQLYQVKDITQLSHDVVRLRHSVKTMLWKAGETDKENVLNYDSPKFKISENSEQWLSVTSKESGKEIFNNFGFTQNVNENDKKELQKIEQFMSEWEHGSFRLPEVEVETEDMDFDMGY